MLPLTNLLGVDDVAELLGCSTTFVRRIARKGDLAWLKLGGHVKFRPDDVAAYIAARRRPAKDTR